ncbi:ABC-type transport system periplasmic substrate-binding protein (probable substrate thiamine) [Natrialba magadii ATCC 43099]|uniref:ABC transporter substrate-binding protein n=1 Tax=Natrialba magadii (strain ATCC 43099 / DSM 3394 / CCM 3739 / CIP 104546 / IAM 13178 / JCM 8861 / NBRC 102185 / NCIMB 2190 / MS3) TaxID=547559 RepID=D3SVA3_NATMM|nr:thiamine ABC transporter substrate-binding protein [Natrialba magadii]ADD05511.1 ABC-type transport system periplasmic substrate-binding protein (probable substrate thiamine) [Natrialba magadii ATCC 43099]ELY29526.1 ABC transporter substrate-binding protein [Natrialba magadii ATCC 43099]
MDRRTFVHGVGGGSVTALAGCLTRNGENEEHAAETGPLRVATYTSFATGSDSDPDTDSDPNPDPDQAPSPAGDWFRETVEEEFEEEIEWTVPESGIEHYIQRARLDADIDTDVILGLTASELALVDSVLDAHGDTRLFESLERDRLEHADRIQSDLAFDDPRDRVLPVGTSYLSLVYDETVLESPPETFDDLLDSAYADTLLAQDPRVSNPGQAFFLWTVAEYGSGSGMLSFWEELQANGVRIEERWTDAYRDAYLEGERPMVVSYSTDQVVAAATDRDMQRHQVAPLDNAGYRSTEGAAIFADATRTELAYEFVDLLLSQTAQAELATRNAQFPAVSDEYVDLDATFLENAVEPDETVTLTYDDLEGEFATWLETWDDEIGD